MRDILIYVQGLFPHLPAMEKLTTMLILFDGLIIDISKDPRTFRKFDWSVMVSDISHHPQQTRICSQNRITTRFSSLNSHVMSLVL
jgi:hypothetical protein